MNPKKLKPKQNSLTKLIKIRQPAYLILPFRLYLSQRNSKRQDNKISLGSVFGEKRILIGK